MSRATLIYKIKDEAENNKQLLKKSQKVAWLLANKKRADKREIKINKLPKYKKFLIIKLRKITNYLINKWI
jgi:hypothetical protein